MAEVQQSGPLPPEKFTQGRWTQIFGAEAGIVGDTDGSAFGLTLPPSSDVAEVGSPTLESVALVGGFPLIIPAGTTQSIEIPASTNAGNGRTDLIVARFDAATYTTAPGPVRLIRIAGTEGATALPVYDSTLPSPDTLPLWAVTRKLGESLSEADARDLRARTGPMFVVPGGTPGGLLPQSAPLGSRATRAGVTYRREMVGSSAQWVEEAWPVSVALGTAALGAIPNWTPGAGSRMERQGPRRWLHGEPRKSGAQLVANGIGGLGDSLIAMLPADSDRPPVSVNATARVVDDNGGTYMAGVHITTAGQIYVNSTLPNVAIRTVIFDAYWTREV